MPVTGNILDWSKVLVLDNGGVDWLLWWQWPHPLWATSLPEYSVCLQHLHSHHGHRHHRHHHHYHQSARLCCSISSLVFEQILLFRLIWLKSLFRLLSSLCFEKILVFSCFLPFHAVCKCTGLLSRTGKSDLLFKTTPRPPCPRPPPPPPPPPSPQHWNHRNQDQCYCLTCGGKVGWSAIWIIDSTSTTLVSFPLYHRHYIIHRTALGVAVATLELGRRELSNKFSPGDGSLRGGKEVIIALAGELIKWMRVDGGEAEDVWTFEVLKDIGSPMHTAEKCRCRLG